MLQIQNNKQQEVPLTQEYPKNPYYHLYNSPPIPVAPHQIQPSNEEAPKPMNVKVSFLVKVLLIFIMWSVLFFFGYTFLIIIFSLSSLSTYYPVLLPLLIFSGLMVLAVLKLGTIQESRNCCASFLFLICLMIAHVFFISLFATFLVSVIKNVDERTVLYYVAFVEIIGNGLSTIVILIHLLTTSKDYGYECPIAVLLIFLIPLAVFIPDLLPYMPLTFVYCFLLIRAMKQLQQGKHNLTDDQVLAGVLSLYYQILTPW